MTKKNETIRSLSQLTQQLDAQKRELEQLNQQLNRINISIKNASSNPKVKVLAHGDLCDTRDDLKNKMKDKEKLISATESEIFKRKQEINLKNQEAQKAPVQAIKKNEPTRLEALKERLKYQEKGLDELKKDMARYDANIRAPFWYKLIASVFFKKIDWHNVKLRTEPLIEAQVNKIAATKLSIKVEETKIAETKVSIKNESLEQDDLSSKQKQQGDSMSRSPLANQKLVDQLPRTSDRQSSAANSRKVDNENNYRPPRNQ
jgi:hypothetical protein